MADQPNIPLTSNEDDRPRDLMRSQREEKRDEASPASSPGVSPSTPPPMPIFPTSFLGGMMVPPPPADIKSVVADVIAKSLTINGQSPSVSNGQISFTTQPPPSASQIFSAASQGTSSPSAQPASAARSSENEAFNRVQNTNFMDRSYEQSKQEGTHAGGTVGRKHKEKNSDQMSDDRMAGEKHSEHKERQEQVKELKKDPALTAAVANGDTSYFGKSFIPVLLTRADGKRKVLVSIDNSFAGVVEGSVGKEKTRNLPSDDAYYTSDIAELAHPWKIYLRNIKTGESNNWKFGVSNQSDVYDGITWSKSSVTGLLTDPGNSNDSGWRAPQTGFVFLWGTVGTDGTIKSIALKNDQASLADIKRVDSASGKQTQFAHVLGYLSFESSGDGGMWIARQEAFRHVTLMYVVVNGVLCKVPFEM